MVNYSRFLYQSYSFLEKENIIEDIIQVNHYFDEPGFYQYTAKLKCPKKPNVGIDNPEFSASGLSTESKALALAKCLGEALERLSIKYFSKNITFSKSIEEINHPIVDLGSYSNQLLKYNKFTWVKVRNLLNNHLLYMPAQLFYPDYAKIYQEPVLWPTSSNGTAGGQNKETAIINAIYEIVERDAFFVFFLTKKQPKKIAINNVNSAKIQSIHNICEKFRFNWLLFDITSNIKIPTFMSIVIDKSHIQPNLNIGSATNLNIENAIMSSLESAFIPRQWLRQKLARISYPITHIDDKALNKAIYWNQKKNIKKLDYLIRAKTITTNYFFKKQSPKLRLKQAASIITNAGYQIFYKNISLNAYKKIPFYVCKVFIPKMQPVCDIDETQFIMKNRISRIENNFTPPLI